MRRFDEGDRIRIDIPDTTDPDHDRYHGVEGEVAEIISDDGDTVTDDDREGLIYRIKLETDEMADFRWRDLRPSLGDDS